MYRSQVRVVDDHRETEAGHIAAGAAFVGLLDPRHDGGVCVVE